MKLMKYLLRLGAEQTALFNTGDDDAKFYRIGIRFFTDALNLGNTAMLAELIRATGVGIPFDDLVEKSGVVLKDTPKYYQGLTVAGKKRTDWAQAGRPQETKLSFGGSMTPPLLTAAHVGSIASVEWFLSDAPARIYKEFKEANIEDKRIKALEQIEGGFDGVISSWLNARSKCLCDKCECTSDR